MHERYWELNGSPFQGTADLRWFWESPAHDEAVARLLFVVEQRRRFGLMLGPAGTGKTLVLKAARRDAERLGRSVAAVDLFGLDSNELLWQLSIALRLGPRDDRSRWWLWQAICDHLQALHSAHVPAVLFLDHLERADADCLEVLERLLHLDAANDSCLTILAAARDNFDEQVFPELTELSEFRIELPLCDRRETEQFVTSLLHKAGSQRQIFTPGAFDLLYEISQGVPRTIVRLCDIALAAGAHQELLRIDGETLLAVVGELPSSPRRRAESLVLSGVL